MQPSQPGHVLHLRLDILLERTTTPDLTFFPDGLLRFKAGYTTEILSKPRDGLYTDRVYLAFSSYIKFLVTLGHS